MKIVKNTNCESAVDFLKRNFSSPTHWPDWNLVVSKHFKTDFFYLYAYEGDELVGICPVHRQKKGVLSFYQSGQFHFIPYGGWIFSRNVNYQQQLFSVDNFGHFQAFCLPVLQEFGFQTAGDDKNFQTLVLDLKDDLDTIWTEQIHSKRKNMIRKAEKNDIQIDITKRCNNSFFDIYQKASTRNELDVLALDFFSDLLVESPNISIEILSAVKNNEPIANLVIVYDKDYAIYWLGNHADNAPNSGQGELLQWEAIKRMKEKGCSYYDLCYIEKERLPHIYKFKSGFCKNETYVPFFSHKTLLFKIINKLNN
ncbi:GNAT family N-acetyltransferase [Desulfotignum phosphitoxidans]|uniref:Putative meticillin resistance protein n=1 Tax=Desulfotignum phosphitoxidans DSM 13687 TaxID=1286635 RepID=S0FRF1_9BACT|nr:GNAT family N-acetyltransferase [Desulfotignum phosphitoxidans]EMS77653.1 putative meticillin resistance protein [Desulfotignum phosphitoxidans DSM 13687]